MLASVARYVCFLAAACIVHTATDRNLAVPSLTAPTRKALPGLLHCISISFHGNFARASNRKQRSWLWPAKNTRLIARKANKHNLFSHEIPSSHSHWETGSKSSSLDQDQELAHSPPGSDRYTERIIRYTITWRSAQTRAAQIRC